MVATNNLVIVSDNLGTILAYDTSNYKLLWRNDFSVPFLSNIVFDKNLIYVTNSNGKLFSFDAISGKQNWSYETGSEIVKSSDSFKISIFNNKLIFSNDMSFVYCLDLQTKSILWSTKLPFKNNYSSSNVFKLENLIIENNILYISSSYGNLSKINADNGILIWDNYLNTNANLLINPSSIAAISKDGFFLLFDKINGNLIYQKNITDLLNIKKNKFSLTYLYLISNKFNIFSGSGNLIQINSKNFDDYTANDTLNKIVSNVIIFDNRLYYLDLNGFLNYVE